AAVRALAHRAVDRRIGGVRGGGAVLRPRPTARRAVRRRPRCRGRAVRAAGRDAAGDRARHRPQRDARPHRAARRPQRSAPAAQRRSLRAVLDWSHELLDDEERIALRRLGRFAGAVDIPAASAVTGQPPAAMADLVGRLADKSLLVHRHGGERWSQLETVRAYALDKLIEAGELDEVTGRYLRWAGEL